MREISTTMRIPKKTLKALTYPYNIRSLRNSEAQGTVTIRNNCTCTKCCLMRRKLGIPNDCMEEYSVSLNDYANFMMNFDEGKFITCPNWTYTLHESASIQSNEDLPEKNIKSYTVTQCHIMITLLNIVQQVRSNGIIKELDLDDIVAMTGYGIATIRRALEVLRQTYLIEYKVMPYDSKLIDVMIIGYDNCYKKDGDGYLVITGYEYQLLSQLRHTMSYHICLIGLEQTDITGDITVYASTIRSRFKKYVRAYQIDNAIWAGEDADIIREFLSPSRQEEISKDTSKKNKHLRSFKRVIFTFSRLMTKQNRKQFIEDLVEQTYQKLLHIALNEFNLTEELIEKLSKQLKKVAQNARNFSEDLVVETFRLFGQNPKIDNIANYIQGVLSKGYHEAWE